MLLRIRHYRNGLPTDEIWNGTLANAQDIFCQRVRDGTLDWVEIWTADNELIFHYPQEMHQTSP